MRHIILIVHNVRSCHNVGSMLRTAEGLGVDAVYLTGYTPYPQHEHDGRLPHLARKIDAQIHKTALGAEHMVAWSHEPDITSVIADLKLRGFSVVALEQDKKAVSLPDFKPTDNVALLVGREVEGIEPEVLSHCEAIVEIPMFGMKESFNVSVAAAMALYQLVVNECR